MARALRPRPPIVVAPMFVSQHTAPAVFGFKNDRAFLEFVATHDVPHVRDGKDVIVDVEHLRAALLRLGSGSTPISARQAETSAREEQPESADGVLRALGLRRAS